MKKNNNTLILFNKVYTKLNYIKIKNIKFKSCNCCKWHTKTFNVYINISYDQSFLEIFKFNLLLISNLFNQVLIYTKNYSLIIKLNKIERFFWKLYSIVFKTTCVFEIDFHLLTRIIEHDTEKSDWRIDSDQSNETSNRNGCPLNCTTLHLVPDISGKRNGSNHRKYTESSK